ncbi:MAG: hypothetical protein Q9208_007754 [Pyrenodesmia sp. 3 TL-2023]
MNTPSSTPSSAEFWLFGYGSLIWKPPPHYGKPPVIQHTPPPPLRTCSPLTSLKDRRVPGYIEGYVRRFWQASEDHRGTPSSPGRVATLISHPHYLALLPPSSPCVPSLSQSPEKNGEQQPKRSRIGVACTRCRKRKIKCSGPIAGLGCQNCRNAEAEECNFLRVNSTNILRPTGPPPLVWGAAYHIPAEHVAAVQSYLDIREINGYSIQYTSFTPSDATLEPIPRCMVYIGLPENPQFLGVQDMDDLAGVIWRSRGPSGENREYLFMLEEALQELGEGAGDEHVEDLARKVREIGERMGGGGYGVNVKQEAVEGEMERVKSGSSGHEQEETETRM